MRTINLANQPLISPLALASRLSGTPGPSTLRKAAVLALSTLRSIGLFRETIPAQVEETVDLAFREADRIINEQRDLNGRSTRGYHQTCLIGALIASKRFNPPFPHLLQDLDADEQLKRFFATGEVSPQASVYFQLLSPCERDTLEEIGLLALQEEKAKLTARHSHQLKFGAVPVIASEFVF